MHPPSPASYTSHSLEENSTCDHLIQLGYMRRLHKVIAQITNICLIGGPRINNDDIQGKSRRQRHLCSDICWALAHSRAQSVGIDTVCPSETRTTWPSLEPGSVDSLLKHSSESTSRVRDSAKSSYFLMDTL